ncbi:hypothetical protein [Pedobacter gandavensis]|uniref:Uncharacterized protein n=1 Tax=Pedobacter gandavensis TaxID=2679963 RepID=A0ABR6EU84_9SPHI|nr:hypothetical protein [Pedobacter gandavensis]MBB2148825.1 hypothetical protein [Pedobacter gandavensis]
MAKIRIPKQYLEGIEQLRLLSSHDFDLLCSTIQKLPKGVGHKLFIDTIVKELKVDESENIAEAIFSFGGLLVKDNFDSRDTAKDIVSSFSETSELELNEHELDDLEDRIAIVFLNSSNIKLTFEAYDLISASQNVIVKTKIKTDVRLLFDNNSSSTSRNGLIFFNLNLSVQGDNDIRDESFTLDHDDLVKLKDQIEDILIQEESYKLKHKDVINFIDITE